MNELQQGLTYELTWTVEEEHLANVYGSGGAAVFSTPMLVALCEQSARLMVDPRLPAGQQTVGTHVDVRHLAATPPGMQVTARAELVEVDGRRLRFHIEVHDDQEQVGECNHERFIIDDERFEQRVAEKLRNLQESKS